MFYKLAGSEFHEDGPETEKEQGPMDLPRQKLMFLVVNDHNL